jgi:hypothetical protein
MAIPQVGLPWTSMGPAAAGRPVLRQACLKYFSVLLLGIFTGILGPSGKEILNP